MSRSTDKTDEPAPADVDIDEAGETDAPGESGLTARLLERLKRPEAPQTDIFSLGRRSSAVLVTIMTAMVFLSLTVSMAAVLLLGYASSWRGGVAAYLTVEIAQNVDGANAESRALDVLTALQGVEGVTGATLVPTQDVEELLAPWFQGRDLTDISGDMALPLLISVEAEGAEAAARVTRALGRFSGVSVDDHSYWTGALDASFNSVFAFTLVFFLVVLVATLSTVALASYGAISRNANTISVLDTIGAAAPFIASGFGRAFLRIGVLSSGLAVIATALVFGALLLSSDWWGPGVRDFVSANFGLSTVLVCLAIAGLHVLVFAFVSRLISETVVNYHLKHAD